MKEEDFKKQGWVKIHRKILQNAIISKPHYAWLWVCLILLANHKEKEFIWNNKKVVLNRGQLLTGRKKLSKITGVKETSVERVLKYLESEHQIKQEKTNKFRVITIINYEKYQGEEHQDDIEETQTKMNRMKRIDSKFPISSNSEKLKEQSVSREYPEPIDKLKEQSKIKEHPSSRKTLRALGVSVETAKRISDDKEFWRDKYADVMRYMLNEEITDKAAYIVRIYNTYKETGS